MEELKVFSTNFTWFDWVIVGVYLSGTVAIGLYVNRYIRSMSDYVVAGRSLRSFLAIATMVGTELGLVTVMYAAQKGFTGGFAAFHIGLAAGIVALIVGLTGFIVVPLREMGVMTIPEYYERRFGRGVRILGGLLLAGGGILNMGMFLFAGAIFLTGLTGMYGDPQAVKIVMTVLLSLVLIYTILGGMVSVVITDYIQFVVLSFGMLLACALAVAKLGWSNIVGTVAQVHREAGFNPLDPEIFGPSYVIWMIFTAGIVSCAVWQTAVMRACAAESTKVVKRLYVWSSIGFMIRFMIPQFLGICALVYLVQDDDGRRAFFQEKTVAESNVDEGEEATAETPGKETENSPDVDLRKFEPVEDKERTLYAMPVFLGQLLPIGLIGLVGAGMLAAFMSTHDSYLLCWSSVLVEDVVNPLCGYDLSVKTRLLLARASIFTIGLFLLIWGLWYPLKEDLWDYMAVTGAIYFTGAFALLLCGLYWKRASRTGAYAALLCGLLAVFGLAPGQATLAQVAVQVGIAEEPVIDENEVFDTDELAEMSESEKAKKLEDAKWQEVAKKLSINGERVGLTTTAMALLLMVAGSLLFPDKKETDGENPPPAES